MMAMCHSKGTSDPKNANFNSQEYLTQRKPKRRLEVLSFTCTTIGINIALACFCEVPNSFGIKSTEVLFKCAFAFLLASVFLGILAMISSIRGYEFLQVSLFPTPKYSALYGLFNLLRSKRSKTFKLSRNADYKISERQPLIIETESSQVTPKTNEVSPGTYDQDCRITQQYTLLSLKAQSSQQKRSSNCSKAAKVISDSATSRADSNQHSITTFAASESSRRRPLYSGESLLAREYGLSTRPLGQISLSPQRKKSKDVLRLNNKRNTLLFGHFFEADSSGFTRGPIAFSCEVERGNETASLVSFQKGSITNKDRTGGKQFCIQSPPTKRPGRLASLRTDSYRVGGDSFATRSDYEIEDSLQFGRTFRILPRDQVSDVVLKLNEMNFVS